MQSGVQTSIEILDRLAAKLGNASDYRVAQELKVSKATVSNWRVGKGAIGEDNAIRIAELLGEDPKFVLACVLAERTKSKEAKKVLQQMAESFLTDCEDWRGRRDSNPRPPGSKPGTLSN